MQFEDFDKKVREAAERHHPAYDEKAWDNMEHLLDKHLPVEKDNRRRIIFFLSLFLLTGISAYLWMAKPWKQSASVVESSKQTIAQPPASSSSPSKDNATTNTETSAVKPAIDGKVTDEKEKAVYSTDEAVNDKNDLKRKSVLSKDNNLFLKKNNNKQAFTLSPTLNNANPNKKNGSKIQNKPQTIVTPVDVTSSNQQPVNTDIESIPVVADKANTNDFQKNNTYPVADSSQAQLNNNKPVVSDSTVAKTEKEQVKEQTKPTDKAVKKNKSSFAFTISGGPDVSSVGISNLGKMNCVFGIGLSYTYNRFTLRSGFYGVKKIYTASGDDYNPPRHYWTNYVDLTEVDANCKVYEIPILLSYNFGETKTQSWFVSTGLSGFLMQKETYKYHYKDTAGNPRYNTWTADKNNKLFSVLNLSGGYVRKFNKTLSGSVEPYFKVPLDGIGFGNIQLNSMGVLFSLNIKPFAGKK